MADDRRDEDAPEGGFEVKDRRRFTAEGELRQEVPEQPPPAAGAAEVKLPPRGSGRERELPEIDFATFVISLSSSAMMHLGVDPSTGSASDQKDLALARQTIDILGILRDKTQGNLTQDEERILQELLYNLRMAYVAACK